MKMGEPMMMPEKPKKKKEVINITKGTEEDDIEKAFAGIDLDIEIEGDEMITIADGEHLNDSVDRAFGADAHGAEVDWAQESKAVVVVARQRLFEDEEISAYMKDSDYEGIVRQVVVDMTTDEEQIRIFQEGINAATDKAKYVEQATNKLVNVMKEESKKRIMDNIERQDGNS